MDINNLTKEEIEFYERTKNIDSKVTWGLILRYPINNNLAFNLSEKGFYDKKIKTILTKYKNKTFKTKSAQKSDTSIINVSIEKIEKMSVGQKSIFFKSLPTKNLTLDEVQKIVNVFHKELSFLKLLKVKEAYPSLYIMESFISYYHDSAIKDAFLYHCDAEGSIPLFFEEKYVKERLLEIFKNFTKEDMKKALRTRTLSGSNGLYFTKFEKYLFVSSSFSRIELPSDFVNELYQVKTECFSKSVILKNKTASVFNWMFNYKDEKEVVLFNSNRINFSKLQEEELMKYKDSNIIVYPLSSTGIATWGRKDYISSLISTLTSDDRFINSSEVAIFLRDELTESEMVEMCQYSDNFFDTHLEYIIRYLDVLFDTNEKISFKNIMDMVLLNEKY